MMPLGCFWTTILAEKQVSQKGKNNLLQTALRDKEVAEG